MAARSIASNNVLRQESLVPTWHIELTMFGLKKRAHEDYPVKDAYDILELLPREIVTKTLASSIRATHRTIWILSQLKLTPLAVKGVKKLKNPK